MTTRNVNGQIEDYLARLRSALEDVWPPRRDQIIADIEEHITAALEELADPTDAAVAQILAKIGDPSEIAAAAMSLEPPAEMPPATRHRLGAHEIIGVALLFGGVVMPVLGWLIGVILLWTSQVWTRRDKFIGTCLVPGGLLPAAWFLFRPATTNTANACVQALVSGAAQSSSTTPCATGVPVTNISTPSVVGALVLAFVFLVVPLLTAIYLLAVPAVRARRTRAGRNARTPGRRRMRLALTVAPIVLLVLAAVSIGTNSWPHTNIRDAVMNETPQYLQLYPVQTTASSSVPDHPPGSVDDGDTATFWATTNPIGQDVTLRFAGTDSLAAISVISGDQETPASFARFAHPQRVELLFSSGPPILLTLPDSAAYMDFTFAARSSTYLELKILSVYPGEAPCAITELAAYTLTD